MHIAALARGRLRHVVNGLRGTIRVARFGARKYRHNHAGVQEVGEAGTGGDQPGAAAAYRDKLPDGKGYHPLEPRFDLTVSNASARDVFMGFG